MRETIPQHTWECLATPTNLTVGELFIYESLPQGTTIATDRFTAVSNLAETFRGLMAWSHELRCLKNLRRCCQLERLFYDMMGIPYKRL